MFLLVNDLWSEQIEENEISVDMSPFTDLNFLFIISWISWKLLYDVEYYNIT